MATVLLCWTASAVCVFIWLLLCEPPRWRRRILPGVPRRVPIPTRPPRDWLWTYELGAGLCDRYVLMRRGRTIHLTLTTRGRRDQPSRN